MPGATEARDDRQHSIPASHPSQGCVNQEVYHEAHRSQFNTPIALRPIKSLKALDGEAANSTSPAATTAKEPAAAGGTVTHSSDDVTPGSTLLSFDPVLLAAIFTFLLSHSSYLFLASLQDTITAPTGPGEEPQTFNAPTLQV
eukprot:scaffold254024_cov55-Prasinocladus_malaysianus.AAC.1